MPNSDSKPAAPPRLAPEIDEIATYQQRRQSGRPRDREGQSPPGKSRGLLLIWLVLITLTAAIAGGVTVAPTPTEEPELEISASDLLRAAKLLRPSHTAWRA